MQEMLLNWKTTLAGLGAITAGLSHIFSKISDGQFAGLTEDFGLIVVGIGLLTAKDAGVSGAAK